ncbi:glycosyltransferase family 2 protein [Lentimicrobium sp. S6]|uniref:glycosyltransferase family 2 protein n=1 Tax=Lentimicrobium sp. S6 TaxID=2735872 RepID=UPI0015556A0A|nr:glycosyltransferase family 2 protein [Lentimicrobium sp. S6]NPD47866.1 hypothetical protein [Lentimicrobium sp. S6]
MGKIKAKHYILKGLFYKVKNNLNLATINLQRGIELDSNQSERIYSLLGSCYLSVGKNELAHSIYQLLLRKKTDSVIGLSGLAMVAQSQENWEEALKYWDLCFAKNKGVPESWWLVKRAFALLETGRYEEATTLFITLQNSNPNDEWGHIGLAQVAQKTKGIKDEMLQIEKLLDKYPDQDKIRMRYGVLLRKAHRFEEAEECFQYVKAKKPNDRDILSALFWTARTSRQYEVAVKRSEELIQKFPGNDEFVKMHLHALIDTLEYDEAQAIFDKYKTERSDSAYLIMQAVIFWEKLEIDKALDEIEKLRNRYPKDIGVALRNIGFLGNLFRSTNDKSYLHQSLKILENLGVDETTDERLIVRQIEISILLGRNEDALKILAKLPQSKELRIMELRAWACHIQGDEQGAKQVWKELQQWHYLPHIQFPGPDVLKFKSNHSIEIEKESIIIYTAVRNERWRLPWFLKYYRELGVDCFLFVDNNSTDGTTEYLMQQDDVFLFWTDQNYAKSYSGMQWVNWLVEEYGDDCWCIYVDVDEAMIFPDIENQSLKDLTNYMAKKGHEAMYAFMLDMYNPDFKSVSKGNDYFGFQEDYPVFDNEYLWINSTYCPYKYTAGGVRDKLEIHENQTKTPIIRGGKGIKFLMSSHRVSPAILTDVSGVLLHYKLAGDFKKTFANDLTDNTRMPQCKRRHWGYLKSMDNLKTENDNISKKAVYYQSSQQLVKLGLIKTSEDFENNTEN